MLKGEAHLKRGLLLCSILLELAVIVELAFETERAVEARHKRS